MPPAAGPRGHPWGPFVIANVDPAEHSITVSAHDGSSFSRSTLADFSIDEFGELEVLIERAADAPDLVVDITAWWHPRDDGGNGAGPGGSPDAGPGGSLDAGPRW